VNRVDHQMRVRRSSFATLAVSLFAGQSARVVSRHEAEAARADEARHALESPSHVHPSSIVIQRRLLEDVTARAWQPGPSRLPSESGRSLVREIALDSPFEPALKEATRRLGGAIRLEGQGWRDGRRVFFQLTRHRANPGGQGTEVAT
jgi:hypothetical protein